MITGISAIVRSLLSFASLESSNCSGFRYSLIVISDDAWIITWMAFETKIRFSYASVPPLNSTWGYPSTMFSIASLQRRWVRLVRSPFSRYFFLFSRCSSLCCSCASCVSAHSFSARSWSRVFSFVIVIALLFWFWR